MLNPDCFTQDWIDQQGGLLNCRVHSLLEKAIVALQLVGHLVESGLPFQFKGGTSLLLLLNPIRRLSIDVDIVTQATHEQMNAVLQQIEHLPPFREIVHDPNRDRDLPPKKHFRAGYPSIFPPHDGHILLDVLFESAAAAQPTLIRAPFIQTEREVRVHMPDANGLLGDKLTAFAPRTIGILEHPERTVDVVKQMFDVAALFDVATDPNAAAAAYEFAHGHQCTYRKQFSISETLEDTLDASVSLGWNELRGPRRNNAMGLYLKDGVARLQNHIVNGQFARDQSQTAAGKVACIAAWIKTRPQGVSMESLRFSVDRIDELRGASLLPPWRPLERLRGGNPEAFFYWRRAQQLLNGDL